MSGEQLLPRNVVLIFHVGRNITILVKLRSSREVTDGGKFYSKEGSVYREKEDEQQRI